MTVIIAALGLCSACGGQDGSYDSAVVEPAATAIPIADPSSLLPLDDVIAMVGYDLVLDGGEVDIGDGYRTAFYRTDPIGQADVVKITVYQKSETVSEDEVCQHFYEIRDSRPSAEQVSGLGTDAYIAFPSIHVYQDGYHIEITAGSGADDGQKALLDRLARLAVDNLNALLSPDASAAE